MLSEITKYFPLELSKEISSLSCDEKIKEIRIRADRKVCIIYHSIEIFLKYVAHVSDLLNILVNISKNSIYAIQNDINNGFVVIQRWT